MATIFKDINDNSMIIDDGLYDTFDDALDGSRIIIKTDCFNNSEIDLDKDEDYDNYLQSIKIEKNIILVVMIQMKKNIWNIWKDLGYKEKQKNL